MNQTLIRHSPPTVGDLDAMIAVSRHDLEQDRPAATKHARPDLARMAGEWAFISLLVTVAIGAMLLGAATLQLPISELTWAAKVSATIASALAIAIVPCAAIDAQRR